MPETKKSWLENLQSDLKNFDMGTSPPLHEVEENDTVVGVASDDLRRLYSLALNLKKTALQMAVELKFQGDTESLGHTQSVARLNEVTQKADAFLAVFWVVLKDEHRLWLKDCVGIRRGWKVVWSKNSGEPPFLQTLRSIFEE